MCGIAIILSGSAIETPPFAIDKMVAALAHRGPDDRGVLRLPGCHLGHTRLSVIDLAGGSQPMTDATGRYSIVFNGEIYNYRELRQQLQHEGCSFTTHSDTEVLLQCYIRNGSAALEMLNGQFAFAIWDATARSLFAGRDRFGEKPLFWAAGAGGYMLASEIKAILASGLVSPHIDPVSVDAYLGLFYVPPDRTIYEEITPVAPGGCLRFDVSRDSLSGTTGRYIRPQFSSHDVDETEAVKQIRQLLEKAVERQMVADVPIGAFLSGGLDSSTIVAMMARQSSQKVRTFSVGFGDLIDELPFAREVAGLYQTDHHELQMNIDVPAMLGEMDRVYDEPFADSSNIPTYLVAQYARRHVKVVLSGDGGDEMFGGYDWYSTLLTASPVMGKDVWGAHVGSATGLQFDRSILWQPRRQPDSFEAVRRRYGPGADDAGLDPASNFDLACYMPGDILVKVDRAAMAHGLEVRAPFLDTELCDFLLRLPWQMRFRNGTLKYLLRQACADLWPATIRSRRKQGFGAPVRAWLELPGVNEIWQRVTRVDSPLLALLPGVNAVAPQLRPQRKWSLLCLGFWLERRSECLAHLP